MAITSVKFKINGVTHTLTSAGDGTYSASIPAPSESSGSNHSGQGPGIGAAAQGKGYYPGEVVVTDDSGNVVTVGITDATFGNILKLKVLEKVKPTAAIVSPGNGALISNAVPTISFKLTDEGSGINPSKCYIKIDSGDFVAIPSASVSFSSDGKVATCTYTPSEALGEGQHTITVYGTDFDGNVATQVSSSFTVDTVPPTLNITSPTDGTKINVTSVTVEGITNDVTSSPVTVQITVGGKTYTPTVGAGGAFSQAIDGLSEGANTITVKATDSAGKATTVTLTVHVDTEAPVITAITLTPNPVDGGQTYVVTVTVTD